MELIADSLDCLLMQSFSVSAYRIESQRRNRTDFYEHNAIIAADEPFSEYFDASQVWFTLTDRMFYGELRFYSVCIIRTYVESRFRVTIHLCIFSVKFLKNHLQTELNFQMK